MAISRARKEIVFSFRSYAPVFIKRIAWNWKHRGDKVDPAVCPHELVEYLQTVESPAGIVDMGCGPGNLLAALRQNGWNGPFTGVDVSERTIEFARKVADKNADWQVRAMEDFPTLAQKVSTICFCETIYYVKPESVAKVLERCRQSLVPGGRIAIRIIHTERHREHIDLLLRLGAEDRAPLYVLNN
jgi:SAM-dependent methyltransferase